MIPYITNRGGPMVGLEALSMQGLPVNELLLTRETEDQLADLAGNAGIPWMLPTRSPETAMS